jgi:hypothetical protein
LVAFTFSGEVTLVGATAGVAGAVDSMASLGAEADVVESA